MFACDASPIAGLRVVWLAASVSFVMTTEHVAKRLKVGSARVQSQREH